MLMGLGSHHTSVVAVGRSATCRSLCGHELAKLRLHRKALLDTANTVKFKVNLHEGCQFSL
jgi:hypothetical protein